MNCRKVSGLLSAYLDRELTDSETEVVSGHLETCSLCRSEYESLRETKRMLASLAFQTSRVELEELLLTSAERSTRRGPLARFLPEGLSDRLAYWGSLLDSAPAAASGPPSRFRALAATALLSLAGICLASASLNSSRDETFATGMDPAYPLTLGANLSPAMRAGSGVADEPPSPIFLGRGGAAAATAHAPGVVASPGHPGWMPPTTQQQPYAPAGMRPPTAAVSGPHGGSGGGHWHFPSPGGYGIVPTRQTSFIYRYAAPPAPAGVGY